MKVNIGRFHKNNAPRTIKVQIDSWDTYNVDHTLALVILPLLKQYNSVPHGSSFVDNEDVPKHMRIPKGQEFQRSDEWEARWKYVIDEMIHSFERIVDDNWTTTINSEEWVKEDERIANGLRLFGKYFRGLWT